VRRRAAKFAPLLPGVPTLRSARGKFASSQLRIGLVGLLPLGVGARGQGGGFQFVGDYYTPTRR
jgi:hypothetical protein